MRDRDDVARTLLVRGNFIADLFERRLVAVAEIGGLLLNDRRRRVQRRVDARHALLDRLAVEIEDQLLDEIEITSRARGDHGIRTKIGGQAEVLPAAFARCAVEREATFLIFAARAAAA